MLSNNQTYEMLDRKDPPVTVRSIEDENEGSQDLYSNTLAYQPHDWPTEPGRLQEDHQYEFMMNAYDAFLCFIPLFLIAKTTLCIVAWSWDRENTGYYFDQISLLTTFLIEFNEQVVTAFTIVFVTIMTTMTRRLALYHAQEGAYITDIEQLQASISLPSTIKMVFSLRKFTKFSAALVAVWSFYYLGSQASKREYAYAPSAPYHDLAAIYPTDDLGSQFDLVNDVNSTLSDALPFLNNAMTDAYESSWRNAKLGKSDGLDSTGQTLIPDLDTSTWMEPTAFDWVKVRPSEFYYVSRAGRPLPVNSTSRPYKTDEGKTVVDTYWSDTRIVGDYTFKANHMKLACSSIDVFPIERFPIGTVPNMMLALNVSALADDSSTLIAQPTILEFWARWNSTYGFGNPESGYSAPLFNNQSAGSVKVSCNVTRPRVEMRISCQDTGCLVKQARYLHVNLTDLYNTPISKPAFASSFLSNLIWSFGVPDERYYGMNSEQYWYGQTYLIEYANVTETDLEEYNQTMEEYREDTLSSVSHALTEAVNTYWNVALNASTPFETLSGSYPGWESITVHGAIYDQRYEIYWPWIAVDYFSCLLLLVAAAYSFWLRKKTLAPDIFGYVSSLTRDNPHVPVPPGGSTMSGIERARHLQDYKLKIVDVKGGEVGKVGVAVAHQSTTFDRLSKQRKYM
ncbi:hypothetical protein LTR05_008643 [Lithohypha guttulata]|uniref:Uncharacterized protein n=1 Tax=Lithohypha guttulata TaxID=1690604 RepID=A0AAN7PHG2_9EURO|nr:hypothetical protein LTR05_008643 [Lithohypha guttulata]